MLKSTYSNIDILGEVPAFFSIKPSGVDDSIDDATIINLSHLQKEDYFIARDHLKRVIKKPTRYTDKDQLITYALFIAHKVNEGLEPSCYSEAISCDGSSKWLGAMNEEIQNLYKNKRWKLCELLEGKKYLYPTSGFIR